VAVFVNVDNFVRAETDRMFRDIQLDAGGPNRFRHDRAPASVDEDRGRHADVEPAHVGSRLC
jgi:hypothetical protein